MTRDEAITVVEMLIDAIPDGGVWTAKQIDSYAKAIMLLDPEVATHTVLYAQKNLSRRPPVADFLVLYRIQLRRLRPQEREREPLERQPAPQWVRRWVAARWAYGRFGKPQDMRRFPQQEDFGDLTQPLMPDGEWDKEAEQITEEELWRYVRANPNAWREA